MLTQTSNKEKKEKTANREAQVHHGWKPITMGFNRSNKMLTQTSNKQKKADSQTFITRYHQTLDAKTQTSNKEKKGKKNKTEKQIGPPNPWFDIKYAKYLAITNKSDI